LQALIEDQRVVMAVNGYDFRIVNRGRSVKSDDLLDLMSGQPENRRRYSEEVALLK